MTRTTKFASPAAMVDFWQWFFRGSGAGPGIRRFIDRWLALHLVIGALFAWLLPGTLEKAGTGLLLPLAGILIGLSFAWGGNAQAILQTPAIRQLSKHREGGFVEYLYTFQAAILLILVSLSLWAVAGLGIFDSVWPTRQNANWYRATTGFLFFFASMTLRECWQVVAGAQSLLLVRFNLEKQDDDKN